MHYNLLCDFFISLIDLLFKGKMINVYFYKEYTHSALSRIDLASVIFWLH